MTGCTASRYGDHDYSEPPHNTPDDPRDVVDDSPCQSWTAEPPYGSCTDEREYKIVLYQIGSHDWIRLFACGPCTASLRARHRDLGPGGAAGIARVRDAGRQTAAAGEVALWA